MTETGYHLIVIVVAAFAVIKGFRTGFTGQISGILGFAFGAVCAHVFEPDAEEIYRSLFPGIRNAVGSAFIYSVMASVTVYCIVFLCFRLFTKVLRAAMQVFYVGMLDSIFGAAFSLLKYLLFISILFNLILCVNPNSSLLKATSSDDGNVVEAVVLLAPAVLGCGSALDLSHLIQLREAKKISCNLRVQPLVIKENSHRNA